MRGRVRLPPSTQIGGVVDHPDPQLRSSTTSSSSSSAVLPSSCSGWWDGMGTTLSPAGRRQPWDDGEGVMKEPFGGAGSAFLQHVQELDFALCCSLCTILGLLIDTAVLCPYD